MKTLQEHINEQLLMELRSTKKKMDEIYSFENISVGDIINYFSADTGPIVGVRLTEWHRMGDKAHFKFVLTNRYTKELVISDSIVINPTHPNWEYTTDELDFVHVGSEYEFRKLCQELDLK